MTANELVLLSSRQGDDSNECIPAEARIAHEDVLLMRFPSPWGVHGRIERAFLVLTPTTTTSPDPAPAALEVRRVEDPWTAATASSNRPPHLSLPLASVASLHASSDAPLRLDVTAAVRHWQARPTQDHGLAVVARGNNGWGTAYSTGASGAAPRLDVYLR